METKPHLTLDEYMRISRYSEGSVAMLIERYIREMNGTDNGKPVKVLGTSHTYTLRTLQEATIGAVPAKNLTKHHVIEHAKRRLETVCSATINHDIGYLSGVLKYAASAWDDCEDVSDAAVSAAKPFLVKHGYVGKSTPRKRVPTDDEIARLLAHFAEPPKKRTQNFIYAMPDIVAFALVSTRRIGEICRITHSDIDWVRKTYWVRDLKHPTKKIGNDKEFCLFDELVQIINRQPRKEGDDRIFPFDSKSVGAKYTLAKKALGIEGLHFHDNRRQAITNWLKTLTPHQVRLISGHETTLILERVYDASDPADLHQVIKPQTERLAAWSSP